MRNIWKKWAGLFTLCLVGHNLPADQTITGNLTVTGTGDFQGSTLSFGTRSDTLNPGAVTIYTDGTTSTYEFDASRSANLWKWQQNGSTTLQTQMSLSSTNTLVLYNQASPPVAEITLNPLGASTFVNSVTIKGTDNEMPSQTVVNANSVLTKGLADGMYAHATITGYVGIGTSTPFAPLDVGGDISTLNHGLTTPIATFSDNSNTISGIDMRNTSSGTTADFRFTVSDNKGDAYLAFSQPGTGNTETIFGQVRSTVSTIFSNAQTVSRTLAIGTFNAKDFILGTNDAEVMRLTSAGNIGIGTSAPAAKLEVNGSEKVDGTVTAHGNVRCQPGGDITMGGFISGTPP